MKKILFFVNALAGGGAEKVLVDLVNNLDKTKFDVTVHVLDANGIYRDSLDIDVKYKYLYKNKSFFIRRLKHFLFTRLIPTKLVYKFFVDDSYDIEVAFLEGFPTKLISYSNNVKKYAWVHTDLYNNYYGMEKIYKDVNVHGNTYKKFRKIFCVSKMVKDAFVEKFGFNNNVMVQYNLVDNLNILKLGNESLSETDVSDFLKFVYVGRLEEVKGPKRLLDVAKKLKNEGYNFELWMLGDGVLFKDLSDFIVNNGLSENVKMFGFQNNPYKYIKACDLFICPSYVEGYSTVALETIILGIPALTTRCSGMNEIFGDSEYGIIVENSFDGLYAGIKSVVENPEILSYYKEKVKIRAKEISLDFKLKEFESIFD